MVLHPAPVCITQLPDLVLEPCCKRFGRAGSGYCGCRRCTPARIWLRARIVSGEILDDYRTVVAFQRGQRGENDSLLEGGVARRPKRPAQFERYP